MTDKSLNSVFHFRVQRKTMSYWNDACFGWERDSKVDDDGETTVVILMSWCHVIIQATLYASLSGNEYLYITTARLLCANVNWQLRAAETEWNYTWNEYMKPNCISFPFLLQIIYNQSMDDVGKYIKRRQLPLEKYKTKNNISRILNHMKCTNYDIFKQINALSTTSRYYDFTHEYF